MFVPKVMTGGVAGAISSVASSTSKNVAKMGRGDEVCC